MNLSQIKDAVSLYSDRSDAFTRIELLIPVVEQRIYNGEADTPALRISAMLKTATSYALPSDWLEMDRVSVGKSPLDYSPYEEFVYYAGASGTPRVFSIFNRTLSIAPTSVGQSVDYSYYARFAALDPVDLNGSNWITANAPSLYINGLLVEIARFTQDNEMLSKEVANYRSTVLALMASDKAAMLSGRSLRQRSMPRHARR